MVIDRVSEHCTGVTLGPRLKAEIARRIHELENRYRATPQELRELAQLRDFLRTTPSGGQ